MIFLNSEGVEVDSSGKPMAETKVERTSEVDTLKQQVNDLKIAQDKALLEAKTLSEKLKEAQTKATLPDDAKARLVAVNGISEALADKALAALAAK